MKLRTTFIASLIIFSLTLLGVAGSVLRTTTSFARIDEQLALSGDVARGAGELGFLASEYLFYGEETQLRRWESKFDEVDNAIAQLSPDTSGGQIIVARLDENLDRLSTVFEDVSKQVGPEGGSEPLSGVATQVAWSRLAVQSQSIAFDASRLQQVLRSEKADVQRQNTQVTASLFGLLAVAFLGIYAMVYFRTMRSIGRLRDGARVIGSGDLDFTIEEGPKDEIGELSRAFNTMTADLKQVTASKADLEREVAERLAAEEEVRKSERRVRGIIDEVPIGIALIDPSGAVLEINEANRTIWGYALPKASDISEYTMYAAYHHRTESLLQPGDWPAARSLESGEPVEQIVDVIHPDKSRHAVHIRTVPVRDAYGTTERIIAITQDVTETLERQRLDEALNEIGNAMGAALDLDEIAHRLLTAGQLALGSETAWIRLRENGDWVVKDVHGIPDAHSSAVFAEELDALTELAETRGVAVVVSDTEADTRVDADVYRRFGIRSLLAFPVIAQGKVLGVASFHFRSRQVGFSAAQVGFASKLMVSAGVAVESTLLFDREHRIADTLQAALLSPPERITGLRSAYAYRPASQAANVGGDFYDVFLIDADHAGVLVGDVSGKGLAAAKSTSLVRNGIRAYAYVSLDVDSVVSSVNTLVHRSSSPELYTTLFFGVLDLSTGELLYCSGGHPPGIVLKCDNTASFLATSSPVVGAFPHAGFVTETTRLAPGDALLLYTDGLVEARRGREMFGEDRLLDTVHALAHTDVDALPEALLDRVGSFAHAGLRDDTVILCVQYQGCPKPAPTVVEPEPA